MTTTGRGNTKPGGRMSSQAMAGLPLLAVFVVCLGILFVGVCLMLGSIFRQAIRQAGGLGQNNFSTRENVNE
jgi:hypothetical protein